jgi:hypothetical protein
MELTSKEWLIVEQLEGWRWSWINAGDPEGQHWRDSEAKENFVGSWKREFFIKEESNERQ